MAKLIEALQQDGSIPLEAYGHQVGGHHLLVKYEKDTICKPLSVTTREYQFYESLSPELRLFTPGYHGVITVSLEHISSGEIKIMGYPRQATPSGDHFSCSAHKSILGGEDAITSKARDGATYISPWSSQCEQVAREKLSGRNNSFSADYLVLENLTGRFSSPSVLDLKIGTRQHGDDVSPEKVLKHTQTCANSTSASLGVRICGLQKYDAARKEYMFRDKYYGRALTKDGFREELRLFLHNGVQFRADLLTNIIFMLEELVSVVQRQDSYRFYSSSLLIIYDGAEGPKERRGTTRTNGVSTHELHMPSNGENGRLQHVPSKTNGKSLPEMRKSVDIRMIDFDHSTLDKDKYEGPDTGYLLGLQSLITVFSQMLEAAP